MKKNKLNQLVSLTILLFIVAISACKKDKAVIDKPAPYLLANGGNDTATVGTPLVLHSQLVDKSGVIYAWTLNGTVVGTDSTYSYTATSRGDYKITLNVTNAGGSNSQVHNVHVYGKYENGFFIANEGWFGHGTGSLSFYRYDTGLKEDSVTITANPGSNLNPASSTVEFSTIFNGKLYLLTKVHGPLVAMDAYSLRETGRIAAASTSDWRAFVGIDNTRALVSSQTGIYPLDLTTLTTGPALTSVTGQIGDMITAGNYVFVLNASKGVQILNVADYSLAKTISGMNVAFAKTPDGSVWVAGGTSLIKIDPATLNTTTITLPFTAASSWAAWHPGSIVASTRENAVFIAQNGSFSGAKAIYKYIDGNAASLTAPFISIATGKETYGAGVAYNPKNNQLVVTTVQSGFGTNYSINNLVIYDAATGALKKDLPYTGYFFPAITVFH